MSQRSFVAYVRVSTDRQGRSGLGLEAQKAAVGEFLRGTGGVLLDTFVEIESGTNNARPQLHAALAACRLKGATLAIARLDRLSRDAAFLLGLSKAGVDFVAVDMPSANRLTVGIMALVAEEERRAISARTRAALAAAKARGRVLGGWRGGPVVDGRLGAAANKTKADVFAHQVGPILSELQARGMSLRAMAAELTAQGIKTARGGAWCAATVKTVLERLPAGVEAGAAE